MHSEVQMDQPASVSSAFSLYLHKRTCKLGLVQDQGLVCLVIIAYRIVLHATTTPEKPTNTWSDVVRVNTLSEAFQRPATTGPKT